MPPLTAKNLPKIGKKRGNKSGKIGGKEEESGTEGKNRKGSFTLPLLTDSAGYATDRQRNCPETGSLSLMNMMIDQGFPTCGPRAACGPRGNCVRPAKPNASMYLLN